MEPKRNWAVWGLVGMWMVVSPPATAGVALMNATATYSQGSFWGPDKTIDGILEGQFTSWGIYRPENPPISWAISETIVWETREDLTVTCETPLIFLLYQTDWIPKPSHNLGRFRLSYTTDDRSTFADGLAIGGDVSADWTVIDPSVAYSKAGDHFTKLEDLSLLVTGGADQYRTYLVAAGLTAGGITGFRLELLEHPSLIYDGPGRGYDSGNCHLSEFVVLVPEPMTLVFLMAGAAGLVAGRRRERQS